MNVNFVKVVFQTQLWSSFVFHQYANFISWISGIENLFRMQNYSVKKKRKQNEFSWFPLSKIDLKEKNEKIIEIHLLTNLFLIDGKIFVSLSTTKRSLWCGVWIKSFNYWVMKPRKQWLLREDFFDLKNSWRNANKNESWIFNALNHYSLHYWLSLNESENDNEETKTKRKDFVIVKHAASTVHKHTNITCI